MFYSNICRPGILSNEKIKKFQMETSPSEFNLTTPRKDKKRLEANEINIVTPDNEKKVIKFNNPIK